MEFSFSRGMAAWHNALCLGNYFFSACVAFSSGHGWLALGGDRWRPLVSLTRVERVWWFSDERQAGQRGSALCLCDVLMRSVEIRGLRPYSAWNLIYQDSTAEAALICKLSVILIELGWPVFSFTSPNLIFLFFICALIFTCLHRQSQSTQAFLRSLLTLCTDVNGVWWIGSPSRVFSNTYRGLYFGINGGLHKVNEWKKKKQKTNESRHLTFRCCKKANWCSWSWFSTWVHWSWCQINLITQLGWYHV